MKPEKPTVSSHAISRDIIDHESEAISRNYTHIETETNRRASDSMPVRQSTSALKGLAPSARKSGLDRPSWSRRRKTLVGFGLWAVLKRCYLVDLSASALESGFDQRELDIILAWFTEYTVAFVIGKNKAHKAHFESAPALKKLSTQLDALRARNSDGVAYVLELLASQAHIEARRCGRRLDDWRRLADLSHDELCQFLEEYGALKSSEIEVVLKWAWGAEAKAAFDDARVVSEQIGKHFKSTSALRDLNTQFQLINGRHPGGVEQVIETQLYWDHLLRPKRCRGLTKQKVLSLFLQPALMDRDGKWRCLPDFSDKELCEIFQQRFGAATARTVRRIGRMRRGLALKESKLLTEIGYDSAQLASDGRPTEVIAGEVLEKLFELDEDSFDSLMARSKFKVETRFYF